MKMPQLPEDISLKLFLFIKNQVGQKEFENWVYATPTLEAYLTAEDYFELISADYSNKKNIQNIRNIIMPYLDLDPLENEQLKAKLRGIIERKGNVAKYLIDLHDMWDSGCSFLGTLVLNYGYGLSTSFPYPEYDVEFWQEMSEDAQEALVEKYYPGVAAEARQVLDWLEQGTIVLKVADEDFFFYEVEDKRPR